MGDLTKWLLACIAEDEAAARHKGADAMTGHRWKHAPEDVYQEIQSEVLDNCRHVLAVCKAHREIVELHWPSSDKPGPEFSSYCEGCWEEGGMDGAPAYPCRTVRAIATIYAGRPGWREEWAS